MKTAPDMKVRFSSDLRRKIEVSATKNNRTLNSEIVARLERSFATRELGWLNLAKKGQKPADDDFAGRIEALEAKVALLIQDRDNS